MRGGGTDGVPEDAQRSGRGLPRRPGRRPTRTRTLAEEAAAAAAAAAGAGGEDDWVAAGEEERMVAL